jgi:ketosteroid isomerase-like protein
MSDQASPDVELLRAAYTAFNARDAGAALAVMATDVTWPRAFKGGFVQGHAAVRGYWAEQWAEIDGRVEPVAFHPQPGGRLVVRVHQVVRDLAGAVLADTHVGHAFTIESSLIRSMEVCDPPPIAEAPDAEAGAAADGGA